jgi:Icc-related predicted phosphoesterase
MTRIYPVSDLHLEFCKNPIKTLSRCIPIDLDIDVAVVAGDLCCLGRGLYRALEELEGRAYHTVFVPGNHEAYYSSLGAVREFAAAWNRASDMVHILDNRVSIIEDVRFIGGTMWFPSNNLTKGHENCLNDYTCIHEFDKHIRNENTAFRHWIAEKDVKDAVIVTHHAPSFQSIAPEFKNSPLNAFYYDQFGEAILNTSCGKPQLWIHGHTHAGGDYRHVGSGVRVVSNPVGYTFEPWAGFNPNLIIEVE